MRIIATLGPASRDIVPRLRDAGADSFRINASHLIVDEVVWLASAVRRLFSDAPIVIDLQGAKMRLGHFPARPVAKGALFSFTLAGTGDALPLPHPELFASIHAGETLSFDDDRIRFRVISCSAEIFQAVALSDGTLRPRKGRTYSSTR